MSTDDPLILEKNKELEENTLVYLKDLITLFSQLTIISAKEINFLAEEMRQYKNLSAFVEHIIDLDTILLLSSDINDITFEKKY